MARDNIFSMINRNTSLSEPLMRASMGLLGLFLLCSGFFLSVGRTNPPPTPIILAPSSNFGLQLFRDGLFVEGVVLLLFAFVEVPFRRMRESDRPRDLAWKADDSLSSPVTMALLGLITALGFVLRLINLNNGLWLDEISPVVRYGHLDFLEVLSTYLGSDNHLLNTLLVNISMREIGPSAWAIRLPAFIFGVAAIPLFYGLARFAGSRLTSLSAALLLAVSYHHIFFSQNARGYSAYLTLCLAGSILYATALRSDEPLHWLAYIGCMFFAATAHLNSIFAIAAHACLGLLVVGTIGFRGGSPTPLLIRLLCVFALLGLLILQVYAPVLFQIHDSMTHIYRAKSAGFSSPFSPEFMQDLLHGISIGWMAATFILVPILLAVLLLGTYLLVKRNWLVAGMLILPNVIFGCFVVIGSLHVTPRLFLLALFPAILAVVLGIEKTTYWAGRRLHWRQRKSLIACSLILFSLVLLSTLSLRAYYSLPKQDYAGAVRYLEMQRKSNDVVIVVYLAEQGYKFYAQQLALPANANCYFVRDTDQFEKIVAAHPGQQIWLVTTFERALKIDYPLIAQDIQIRWQLDRQFRGTIADGNICVYSLKLKE